MTVLFYILSIAAITSALMVVFSRNPINSVLSLVVCFICIAGHFILLNAQFLAVVHVIVYTGAIMVLFLFVIMLLNLNKENEPRKSVYTRLAAVIAGGVLFLVLVGAAKGVCTVQQETVADAEIGLVQNIGRVLYTDYLVPFEVSAVLFLSSMIGALMLAKKEKQKN